ncbi:hypothetical protein KLP28_11365 [Nocardioidaceae bacterium]|nr:hypothetical protein KLP28_11365 [Nocardioidaceae bacterium]
MDADVDVIWDRACELLMSDATGHGIEGLREGDRMLADAIHLDGCFQRSGADAMPDLDDTDRDAGVVGLRWFGLDDAADIVETYVERSRRGLASESDELDSTDAYNAIDVEAGLTSGVRERLRDSADSFAPADMPRPPRQQPQGSRWTSGARRFLRRRD